MDIQTVGLVIAVAAVCICLVVFLKKKDSSSKIAGGGKEETQGDPTLYELGMNPVSSKPIMYALQTCPHCRNTRRFLQEKNVDYTEIFVDQYSGRQREDLMEKVRTYNPRGTFPTILLPNGKVIVGFRKQLLQEAFDDAPGRTA